LLKGEDFAALARGESDDPGSAAQGGDLGFFARELMVKAFADAAFEMKPDETRGPIETEFGLHIIRLTEVRSARIRALDEVRSEISTELRRDLASRKLAEQADTFTNTVYEQPDSLEPVAERLGVPLQAQTQVLRAGQSSLAREHPLNHPKVLSQLFSDESIRNRRNIEAVDLGGGRIASARVVAHQPSRQRAFVEVREEVLTAVVREQALQRARDQGTSLLKQLTQSGSSSAAPKAGETADTASFSAPVQVSRAEQSSLPQPALEAIFKAGGSNLPVHIGVDLGDSGYAVYRISAITSADSARIEELRTASAGAIERALAEQDLRDYLESRKAETKISRSLDRITGSARQQ
jgi:peptidyl-prolyl cis-trans isomerase D